MEAKKDWNDWHLHYDDKGSELAKRLILVQHAIRDCLSQKSDTMYQIIDICAGDSRDLLPVLAQFAKDTDIHSYLVEIDEQLGLSAGNSVNSMGLSNVTILVSDASYMKVYENIVPADLILLCGVFGNISMADVETTIRSLSQLSKKGTKVIWTRNLRDPEPAQIIRQLFRRNHFREVRFDITQGLLYGVGVHEYQGESTRLKKGLKLFTFIK